MQLITNPARPRLTASASQQEHRDRTSSATTSGQYAPFRLKESILFLQFLPFNVMCAQYYHSVFAGQLLKLRSCLHIT